MPGFTNLGDLIRRDRDLGKVAVIDLGGEEVPREFSYGALDRMANAVARALLGRGLARGDRVALLSANRAEYLAAYFGIMRAGLVAVPVNFKFPRATIHFILKDAGAKLVFCDRARRADCPDGMPADLLRRRRATKASTASSIPERSTRWCRPRASRRCSSTPPARPERRRASCSRTRATSGWWRHGLRPGSTATAI